MELLEEYRVKWVTSAVFAATYAAITIILAPISFLALQVRVSDAMLMISFHKRYGKEAIIGLTLGGFFANLVSPLGIIDWFFGPLTNFVVTVVIYCFGEYARRKEYKIKLIYATIASIIGSIFIGLIIGFELYMLGFADFILGFIGVFIGSVISLGVIGVTLLSMILKAIPEE